MQSYCYLTLDTERSLVCNVNMQHCLHTIRLNECVVIENAAIHIFVAFKKTRQQHKNKAYIQNHNFFLKFKTKHKKLYFDTRYICHHYNALSTTSLTLFIQEVSILQQIHCGYYCTVHTPRHKHHQLQQHPLPFFLSLSSLCFIVILLAVQQVVNRTGWDHTFGGGVVFVVDISLEEVHKSWGASRFDIITY